MSNEKQLLDNDLDEQIDNLEDIYAEEDGFGSFEDLEDTPVQTDKPQVGNKNVRLWLYLGLLALLAAVTLRLVLGPVLEIQKQRVDQVAEIEKQLEITNSSAALALTATGSFDALKGNLLDLTSNIQKIVLPQNISAKIANRLFGNTDPNAQLSASWDTYKVSVDKFVAEEDSVTQVKSGALQTTTEINSAATDTILFVEAIAKEGRSKRQGTVKDRYLFLTSEAANINGILSRLASGMRGYFTTNTNLRQLSDAQNTLIVRLKDTLLRITANATAVVATAAEPLKLKFNSIEAKLLNLGDHSAAVTETRQSLVQMQRQAEDMNAIAATAVNQSGLVSLVNALTNLLPLLLVAFGIYALWRFFRLQSSELVASEGTLSDALADQQESILKLLDEISALADGDLTVEAEVTDQITGAIADSVNFAVIEMRELVTQINRASLQVASESELAVSNAQSVSLSNMQQAEQITVAAQNMQKVTASMREMSEQASSSSEMAAISNQAATRGTQAVRDTITGMEDMREQIQDTSKRIKRLGESSQRIGDIVALIDDIAEQTNILSLNAAIQASMAGEAGRGFAVVSDEVQSLAERSTEATKKIAALVTTIQNDTNDAVRSMEKVTQQVVSGTKVADTAGDALTEIETVSQRLSDLVEGISKAASSQAEAVVQVAENVTVVSESSASTSRKAQDSANSIAKLLELAKELETSVSRFKLPAS